LVRNLTIAYKVSDWFAEKRHLNLWDVRDVMTTMLVTESGGGFIYANDGQGYREPDSVVNRTPWNWNEQTNRPIGTPEQRAAMRAALRKSLDLPYDKVGSNGRSTGPSQQISVEVSGAWGPMAATMRMDLSVLLFLDAVDWSNRDINYLGKRMANWQTAMLLRVQRPLPSEVATNYGAAQLARAQAIARDERFAPAPIITDWLELLMADQAALDAYKEQIAQAVQGKLRGIDENAGETRRITGVLAGVTSLAGNGERSVEQQVFEHELPLGVGQLGNFLAELNRKVDVIAAAVSDLQNKGV
jgi:hypothetical protein